MTIINPILRGFNPDPSFCRVGDDYYIATSTFEWWPGVMIYHSRDLKNWRLASRPLNRISQLNMLGNPDSGGVWAPQLSWHNGRFWLIYSDMKTHRGAFKDGANYLVTCDTIDGDWSDPVYLNSSGFDPSMFHDDDGKQWLLNMIWDHRQADQNQGYQNQRNRRFYGIVLQQYSNYRDRLVGEPLVIFKGTDHGLTEAPHLYKIGEYYYLLTAEGGTEYGHQATVARSKNIEGPYEVHPDNPLITSRLYPDNPLQKAGHASWVQAADGDWYIVYLMARPIGDKYCPLGRETSIAKLEWRDGWPYVMGDLGNQPCATIETGLPEHKWPQDWPGIDNFDSDKLNHHYHTLRAPLCADTANLTENPGHLRLYGKQSLSSTFVQSHIARRWQSLDFDAATCVVFDPKSFQQMAGLTNYYNTTNWTALYITHHEQKGRVLEIMTAENGTFANPLMDNEIPIPIPGDAPIHLKSTVRGNKYQYHYSLDGQTWTSIDLEFDTHKLSDDFVDGNAFTGAFTGMFCADISGVKLPRCFADFDYFSYIEN